MAERALSLTPTALDGIADRMAFLEIENAQLRKELHQKDADLDKALKLARGMTHAIAQVHEKYGAELAALRSQLNDVALFASLVPGLQKKVEEIGRVSDRTAQFATVLSERVDGLCAREEV